MHSYSLFSLLIDRCYSCAASWGCSSWSTSTKHTFSKLNSFWCHRELGFIAGKGRSEQRKFSILSCCHNSPRLCPERVPPCRQWIPQSDAVRVAQGGCCPLHPSQYSLFNGHLSFLSFYLTGNSCTRSAKWL